MTHSTTESNPFRFDLRSLAAFRMGLGLIMLFDLLDRARDLALFYTDTGVVPRLMVLENFTTSLKFSFHMMTGGVFIETVLFLIHFVAILYFLLGKRTWLANLVCWLFFISVQSRNFVIHQASDTLLCQLLFVSLFLPLGRSYLDDVEEDVLSPGTVAYLLFYVSVLIISGLFKAGSPLWQQGDGIFHAFSSDFHGGRLGVYFLNFPRILRIVNYATVVAEILLPLLLLFVTGKVRSGILIALGIFYFSLFAFLRVGEFPALLIVGLLPFLPTSFWRRVDLPVRALGVGEDPGGESRFWQVAGLTTVTLLLGFEINSVYPRATLPPKLVEFGNAFHLLETWSMFSEPAYNDGWFLVEGLTTQGRSVNLLDGSDTGNNRRPEVPSESYKNQRWLKLFQNMIYRRNLAPAVAESLCRRDEFMHPGERLLKVRLTFHRKQLRSDPWHDYLPPERIQTTICG